MINKSSGNMKVYFTAFVAISIWTLLIWQYFHDGVPSHHFLQRADMPAMSNWWGALILPSLSWFLIGNVQKRMECSPHENTPKQAIVNFSVTVIYGVIMSMAFMLGRPEISSIMFPGILVLALFFKVYRAEFILGLILSLSFTFGAIIPTVFAFIIGFLAYIIHSLVLFLLGYLKKLLRPTSAN